MSVYVVWETWLKPEHAEEGFQVTSNIWKDMPGFEGYLGHFLLRDQDDTAHLLLVSLWESRQAADKSKELYVASQNLADLQPLLARERGRTIYDMKEVNGYFPSTAKP